MNETIISAVIALLGSVIGTFGGILATSKLTAYRLEQLEKKVDKHNNLIERTYKLEQAEAVFEERFKAIEEHLGK